MKLILFLRLKATMNIQTPGVMLFCGAPKSGKTNMIAHIIHAIGNKVPYGFVFCPSIFDGDYEFMPRKTLYEQYEERQLEEIVDWQATQVANRRQDNIFIVVDDLGGQVSFKSAIWQRIIRCHRHLFITLLIGIHYMVDAPPSARTCCTTAFIFRQFGNRSYRHTFMEFGVGFDNETQCKKFIEACCMGEKNRYYCIVYKQGADTKEQMYQRYRAPDMKRHPFRIYINRN